VRFELTISASSLVQSTKQLRKQRMVMYRKSLCLQDTLTQRLDLWTTAAFVDGNQVDAL
jgi:hypothetical protein